MKKQPFKSQQVLTKNGFLKMEKVKSDDQIEQNISKSDEDEEQKQYKEQEEEEEKREWVYEDEYDYAENDLRIFVEEYDYYKVIYRLYKRMCEIIQDKEEQERLKQELQVNLKVFESQQMFVELSKIMIDYQNSDIDYQYIFLTEQDQTDEGQLNRYFLEKSIHIDHKNVKNKAKYKEQFEKKAKKISSPGWLKNHQDKKSGSSYGMNSQMNSQSQIEGSQNGQGMNKLKVLSQKEIEDRDQKDHWLYINRLGIGMNCVKNDSMYHQYNQDDYCLYIDPFIKVFGVFDGYGIRGEQIAAYASRTLLRSILSDPLLYLQPAQTLKQAFQQIHPRIISYISNNYALPQHTFTGVMCTLVIQKQSVLYIAHIGNTKCFVTQNIRGDKPTAQIITTDHLPSNSKEKQRIFSSGGEVKKMGQDKHEKIYARGRVYPGLEYTRALGDHNASLYGVIHEPEFIQYRLRPGVDSAMILGTQTIVRYTELYEITNIILNFQNKDVQKAVNFFLHKIYNSMIKENNDNDDISLIIQYFQFQSQF